MKTQPSTRCVLYEVQLEGLLEVLHEDVVKRKAKALASGKHLSLASSMINAR
jgi:hypothetical protein